MSSKPTNVQNLDIEKSTGNEDDTTGAVRRVIKRRCRDLHFKGFGFTFKFRQQDEQGSEDA